MEISLKVGIVFDYDFQPYFETVEELANVIIENNKKVKEIKNRIKQNQ